MICQKHIITDINSVNESNEIIVHAAIHSLQILSDEVNSNDDFDESEVTRKKYWNIRNSLHLIGVEVTYLQE